MIPGMRICQTPRLCVQGSAHLRFLFKAMDGIFFVIVIGRNIQHQHSTITNANFQVKFFPLYWQQIAHPCRQRWTSSVACPSKLAHLSTRQTRRLATASTGVDTIPTATFTRKHLPPAIASPRASIARMPFMTSPPARQGRTAAR